MNRSARSCLALFALCSAFAVVACSDDDDDQGGENAAAGAAGDGAGGTVAGSAGSPAQPAGAGGESGRAHSETSFGCEVLGELCHVADDGDGPAAACHDVGHVGNAAACAAEFDGCIATCTDKEIGPEANDAKCVALGSLCHPAGEVDAEAEACHELGHDGVAANCAEKFDECAERCLAVLATIEEHGSGGAPHTGAGGQAYGGAAAGGAGGGDPE